MKREKLINVYRNSNNNEHPNNYFLQASKDATCGTRDEWVTMRNHARFRFRLIQRTDDINPAGYISQDQSHLTRQPVCDLSITSP